MWRAGEEVEKRWRAGVVGGGVEGEVGHGGRGWKVGWKRAWEGGGRGWKSRIRGGKSEGRGWGEYSEDMGRLVGGGRE